jgi:hypothetical protein
MRATAFSPDLHSRSLVTSLAAQHRLPAVYVFVFVIDGAALPRPASMVLATAFWTATLSVHVRRWRSAFLLTAHIHPIDFSQFSVL